MFFQLRLVVCIIGCKVASSSSRMEGKARKGRERKGKERKEIIEEDGRM